MMAVKIKVAMATYKKAMAYKRGEVDQFTLPYELFWPGGRHGKALEIGQRLTVFVKTVGKRPRAVSGMFDWYVTSLIPDDGYGPESYHDYCLTRRR